MAKKEEIYSQKAPELQELLFNIRRRNGQGEPVAFQRSGLRDEIARIAKIPADAVDEQMSSGMSQEAEFSAPRVQEEPLEKKSEAPIRAPSSDEDEDYTTKIGMALGTLLPALAGFAVGGYRGGAAGAEATGKTAKEIGDYLTKEEQGKTKAKAEMEKLKLQQKLQLERDKGKLSSQAYNMAQMAVLQGDLKAGQAILDTALKMKLNEQQNEAKAEEGEKERGFKAGEGEKLREFKSGEGQKEREFKGKESDKQIQFKGGEGDLQRGHKSKESQLDRESREKIAQMQAEARKAGGGGRGGSPKITAAQRLAAGFARRLQQAEQDFEGLAAKGYNRASLAGEVSAAIPESLGFLKPNTAKSQEQAEENFINATLRRESGAAISPSEFTKAEKQYFPRKGDGPDVLAQKARNRKQVTESLKAEAGAALDDVPLIGKDLSREQKIEFLKSRGAIK